MLELLAEAERSDSDTHALTIERDGSCTSLALFGEVEASNRVWKLHTLLISEDADPREAGDAVLRGVIERVRALGGASLLAELPADPVYGRTLDRLRRNGFRQPGKVPDFFRDGVALLFLTRAL